jgi:predicted metal-dependent phosphoesterase TrpH
MNKTLKVDFHLHTTESDGVLAPAALVAAVASAGMDFFSITDHDTMAMYERHGALLEKFGSRVISGVEVSTYTGDREVHILGYGLQPNSPGLDGLLTDRAAVRRERAERIVQKLNETGIAISMDDVERQASGKMIGRPHIARALVALGAARDVSDAFDRYIGSHCDAFEPSTRMTPERAIRSISAGGGIPVLAHPTRNAAEELLDDLVKLGLRGIEAYSTAHTAHDAQRFRELARESNLVMTAGTDFHGPTPLNPLPGTEVAADDLAGFLRLLNRAI